ncbi:MAG TPA: hypothetical protein VIO94_10360 [Phenylobacterium sp.]
MPPASARKSGSPPPKRRGTVATHFGAAIATAVEEGTPEGDMTLKLTLSDFADLKRDQTIPVADISFRGGEMRFRGVKVTGGGVETSHLDRGAL